MALLERPRWKLIGLFLAGCLVFLYLQLFVVPDVPVCLQGDQSVYLLNVIRIRDGAVIYRDFFQFTYPATEFVYVALFKLFGVRAWIPHAVLILLGLGLAWLSILLSKRLLEGAAALLPGLLFLLTAFRPWFDASHHWFSALAATGAIAAVAEKRTSGRLLLSGLCCGVATSFTQLRGLLAVIGLLVFLLWESRWAHRGTRWLLLNSCRLLGAFLLPVLAVNFYFASKVGLHQFWYSTVFFGIYFFPADAQPNTLHAYVAVVPQFVPWYRLPTLGVFLFIHALLPLVYVVVLFRYRRQAISRPDLAWDQVMLLTISGLFLFAGVVPAPSWFRLCTVSLPALVLFVWLLRSLQSGGRILIRGIWVGAIGLALAGCVERQARWHAFLNTSVGRMALFSPQTYEKYRWISDQTRPREFVFDAASAWVYFPLGLRNPAPVPYVTCTDYTRPEQVAETVEALKKNNVRLVIWAVRLDLADRDSAAGDHLGPLRSYLRAHYRVVKLLDEGREEIWERAD